MEFAARYQDGLVANVRDTHCVIDLAAEPVSLVVLDGASRDIIDRWPAEDVYLLHTRALELRMGNRLKPSGARLAVSGLADMQAALSVLPALRRDQRSDFWRQLRLIVVATAALASVVVAYLFGIPLLAERLVGFVPPNWEARIGDTAGRQMEATLTGGKTFEVCDPDPSSPANTAIARFVTATFDGLGSPFTPSVAVVRSDVPNAFSLPGGHTYFLSAMLDATRNQDEFEGVLAHELGHVYYRHGLHTLLATSATGLLVGFVLGDMTGLSVAGALGAALIDNRFSRVDEAQADAFAARTASKLGFNIRALADLLDRVAGDTAFSRAFALFSNHPLTDERRRALEALAPSTNAPPDTPFFTSAEWTAIRSMCPPQPAVATTPTLPTALPPSSSEPVSSLPSAIEEPSVPPLAPAAASSP
jgi:Zn-dependent protease with chaperone function